MELYTKTFRIINVILDKELDFIEKKINYFQFHIFLIIRQLDN